MISIIEPIFKQIEFQVESIKMLANKVDIFMLEQEIYPGGRTCFELLTHIALIPEADVMIIKGAGKSEMDDYYHYWQKEVTSIEVFEARLELSMNILLDFYNQLEEDEMLNMKMTYWQTRQTYLDWLLVILTHLTHHRAQLYSAIKQFGDDEGLINLFE
ncbi:DinB family protein [Macrococcoides goetzii]|uniref:DinB family protein n=1 Tax=Macrococcus TaxID=69965 RepID=UPI001EF2B6C7|nr:MULTISPECIES: DinB family protein [Macrococcus]MCG7420934.1 DinB family protein [Macrococcus epidermidis]MCH4984529.1 DinB family protein [Macrococcus sp. PK]